MRSGYAGMFQSISGSVCLKANGETGSYAQRRRKHGNGPACGTAFSWGSLRYFVLFISFLEIHGFHELIGYKTEKRYLRLGRNVSFFKLMQDFRIFQTVGPTLGFSEEHQTRTGEYHKIKTATHPLVRVLRGLLCCMAKSTIHFV